MSSESLETSYDAVSSLREWPPPSPRPNSVERLHRQLKRVYLRALIWAAPEEPTHHLEGESLPEGRGVELFHLSVDLGVEVPPPVTDDRPLEVGPLLGEPLALVHHDALVGGAPIRPQQSPALEIGV